MLNLKQIFHKLFTVSIVTSLPKLCNMYNFPAVTLQPVGERVAGRGVGTVVVFSAGGVKGSAAEVAGTGVV